MSRMRNRDRIIKGFSKLIKEDKLKIVADYFDNPAEVIDLFKSFWHADNRKQKLFDEFSENTLTNFYFPYGVIPNLLLNGRSYIVPMVIEESSVVAAASAAAKFWSTRGGFHAEIIGTRKLGQVHFLWEGKAEKLKKFFPEIKKKMLLDSRELTTNMEKRGGGIHDIELVDMRHKLDHYYQLKASFETVDSMGANFINSCLEEFAQSLKNYLLTANGFSEQERMVTIIMSILSNYTPDCRVKTWVSCTFDELDDVDEELSGEQFARKFETAVTIAKVDVHRATTHNKGIFNGIDAVAMATGNDFRAIEAAGHTWAARNGQYESLSEVKIEGRTFIFSLELPLALGTVGGLTGLHPLAKNSLEMLERPSAPELMQIAAAAGLANNFSAVRSLVTKGIQQGHMKMHLMNILNHYQASDAEKEKAVEYFKKVKVSFANVGAFINDMRNASQHAKKG